MNEHQFRAELRQRLGIQEAGLSDERLLAALDETFAEAAAPVVASTNAPAGTVRVDAAAYKRLQDAAADGPRFRADQVKARHEGIIAAAIESGRVAPAAREAWMRALSLDEKGMTTTLLAIPKNTVPVAEIGYATDRENGNEHATYNQAWGAQEDQP